MRLMKQSRNRKIARASRLPFEFFGCRLEQVKLYWRTAMNKQNHSNRDVRDIENSNCQPPNHYYTVMIGNIIVAVLVIFLFIASQWDARRFSLLPEMVWGMLEKQVTMQMKIDTLEKELDDLKRELEEMKRKE